MQNMQDVLLFEANESMKHSIDPPLNPHLHAVNIESNPGLVTCNRFNKINILSNDIIKYEIQSDLIENIGDFEITSSEKKKIEDNINNHSM